MLLHYRFLFTIKQTHWTAKLMLIVLLTTLLYNHPSYATDSYDPNYEYALKLNELGVFRGSSSGFSLDRSPTRIEGLVMLIRLLGKETEALSLGNKPCVFTDVPSWAIGYANYAKTNNLTQGISPTVFGSLDSLTLEQYTTFLLRSLNYHESNGDFSFATVLSKADSVGIFTTASIKTSKFNRSIVAKLSYDTLLLPIKQSSTSLAQYLVNTGAIDEATAIDIKIIPHPAVIDGKTYALKDSIFYTLGESTSSVDVLSSATIQGAVKTDVYKHTSNKDSKTTSLITFPIEGFSRLAFWVVSSNELKKQSVEVYLGEYTYLDTLSTHQPTKTILINDTPTFVSVDLTPLSTKEITLKFTLQSSGHLYMYSVFLE